MKPLKISPQAVYALFSGFVFVLCIVVIFPLLLRIERRVREMATWPTTTGEIAAAEVQSRYQRGKGPLFVHHVTYRYTVSGRSHTGDRISYGGPRRSWELETEARDRLPAIGSAVPVRYNPGDPAESVIQVIQAANAAPIRWAVLTIGLLAGVGAIVAGRAWRRERAVAVYAGGTPSAQ